MATLHYASGNNIDSQGNFTPSQAGFNLADVSSVDELNSLPEGVKGLVWLDQHDGANQSFIDEVTPYIGNPNVYGFFLTDEPDPTGQWNTLVKPEDLKAESDWIHGHVTGAQTFITMMNMGSSDDPSFANTYTPENTHIDLFGIDPYPVQSGGGAVDYSMIDKAVAAAHDAGIPQDQIVPVFQTFGGGGWVDENGGHYNMPTAAQEQQILDHWADVVPNPAFDYAYAWGSQNGDTALENSQALQNVFLQHNTSGSSTPAGGSGGSATPADGSSGSTTPVAGSGGSTAPADGTGGHSTPVAGSGGNAPTGSDGSPSDPTTDHGGGWQHQGGGGGFGFPQHQGGFDFSQLLGNTSSWLGQHAASSMPSAFAAPSDASTVADTMSHTASDASHFDLGSLASLGSRMGLSDQTDHHAAWHM